MNIILQFWDTTNGPIHEEGRNAQVVRSGQPPETLAGLVPETGSPCLANMSSRGTKGVPRKGL